MDLSNVTVIIPAHNRPDRLRRLLGYYSRTNIWILVSDSSQEPFQEAGQFPQITYRHFPGEQFLKKIYNVLPLIDTPYVFFCADDDFIVPEAIHRITTFLDINGDYATAQGHYLTFEENRKCIEFSPRYIRNFHKVMDGETGKERLEQYNNLYSSILYSICRAGLFKEMYSAVYDKENGKLLFENLYLAEAYFNLYALIHGKHFTTPVFYAARERIKGSAASTTVALEVVMSNPGYSNQYKSFLSILAKKLSDTDGISFVDSYKLIEALMYKPKAPATIRFKQKILNFAGKYSATRWIDNLLYERYKSKGRKIVAGMESYPCQNTTPEIQAIMDSIKSMP